jgi:protein required for attachment to host cells
VEATDWHELEEQHFVRMVAAAMERLVRASKVKKLFVVAPPRTLAELRQAFHPDVKACIVAEVNKDLTNHPVDDIEKHLTGGIVPLG